MSTSRLARLPQPVYNVRGSLTEKRVSFGLRTSIALVEVASTFDVYQQISTVTPTGMQCEKGIQKRGSAAASGLASRRSISEGALLEAEGRAAAIRAGATRRNAVSFILNDCLSVFGMMERVLI